MSNNGPPVIVNVTNQSGGCWKGCGCLLLVAAGIIILLVLIGMSA